MSDAIKPFPINIPQHQLDDLKARLANTRWPEQETVDDWSQGSPLAAVQQLCEYWQTQYDWRRCEQQLNAYGSYITEIDGLDIHFLHIRSPHADATPMIMTHGWPGSIIEFMKVIEPLTNPTEHGGNASDAFHLVIPSLPGYGFSGKPTSTGWGVARIAMAWISLMERLGYEQYIAQGGDWGAGVTTAIAAMQPQGCMGVHFNMAIIYPEADDLKNLSPREQAAIDRRDEYTNNDSGYAKQQATRPQSLAYGLVDSPSALAAWIYEKFYFWTDNNGSPETVLNRDEMLDNIMMYWLTASGGSSARLYWESLTAFGNVTLELPVAASIFPKDLFIPSRRWAERSYKNLVYWNEVDQGGHFAAFEQAELFVQELRNSLKTLLP